VALAAALGTTLAPIHANVTVFVQVTEKSELLDAKA
jgi:hypothetical protein